MMLPLLLFLQVLPQNNPPQKCSLSGTVIDSITAAPLTKTSLWLVSAGGGTNAEVTSSDAKGHFALVNLECGAYRLTAKRNGYLETYYGAKKASASGTILRLQSGQTIADLNFKLTPAGAIAGAIRDSDGEPLTGATVDLSRRTYDNQGRARLERVASTSSDDRGEYRFAGLTPGKYYASVSVHGSRYISETDRSATTGPRESAVTTFYPGAPDASSAQIIAVDAGKRVTGIDVSLLSRTVVCVSGRVTQWSRLGRLAINLEQDSGAMRGFYSSTTATTPEGDFQLCRVPPGSYRLAAFADGVSAQTMLQVGTINVTDVQLALSPKGSIEAKVTAEGAEKPNFREVSFDIGRNDKNEVGGSATESGSFSLRNVFTPDNYYLRIKSAPKGFYVKSIRSGTTNVMESGVNVPPATSAQVEIILSPNGSDLSGTILDKDQQLVPGAVVLLVPDDRTRADLFKTATTDQRGYYEFTALAPGSYKVFAWDEVESNEWFNPDFLRDYEKQSEKAVLEPKSKHTVNVRVGIKPDSR